MKRFLPLMLLACTLAACSGNSGNTSATVFDDTPGSYMGKRFPSEKHTYNDPVTGYKITVLTSTEKSDRALYQTDPMWTSDRTHIIFRSSSRSNDTISADGQRRRPSQNLYFIEEATGEIIQATEGSVGGGYLAHKSNKLFYTRTEEGVSSMYVLELDPLFADSKTGDIKERGHYETRIGDFPKEMGRPGGFAIDCNDDYAYITISREPTEEDHKAIRENPKYVWTPRNNQPIKISHGYSGIRKMNLETGEVSMVIDAPFKIGHIQTSLFTPGEIVYCHETGGDANQRMWFCTADGKVNKPLYKETPLDWVTHETFATEDYVYFNILGFQDRLRKQASGILRINLRTDDVELLGQVEMDEDRAATEGGLRGRGFWHCNASRDNKWAAGDTFAGSIWLINVEKGSKHLLVTDTKMKPDHAHPYFSPDGTKILFQSGHLSDGERLQLMTIDIPKEFY